MMMIPMVSFYDYKHVYVYMYVCMYICVPVFVPVCVCVCVCVFVCEVFPVWCFQAYVRTSMKSILETPYNQFPAVYTTTFNV